MQELIPIREAARRLGVSDTAVRKAATAGRIKIHDEDKDPGNGRPRCRWPDIEAQWLANSDASKRTYVGPTGTSERRAKYAPDAPVSQVAQMAPPRPHPADTGADLVIHDGMSLTEANTAKAIYAARQAKLDYERDTKQVVDAADQRKVAFKLARAARDELQTMEDRLSPILASETDVHAVRQILREDIRRISERIAREVEKL
jgi:hypothetical protein